jgi:hypothetical protein
MENTEKIPLPDAFSLLKESIHICKKHVTLLFGSYVPLFALSTIITTFIISKPGLLSPGLNIFLYILSSGISVLAFLSVSYAYVHRDRLGDNIGLAFSEAYTYIFQFAWVAILMSLAYMGGLVAFVIPGIYLIMLFILSNMVFVVEGKRGMDALVRSWYYIRGRWWEIAGKLFFIGLLSILFMLLFMLISNLVSVPEIVSTITLYVYSAVVAPISIVFTARIYEHLHATKTEELPPEKMQKARTIFTIFAVIGAVAGTIFLALGGFLYLTMF